MSDPRETPSGPNAPRAPRISISRLTLPVHANLNRGTPVGRNMRPADVPGALAAVRHEQTRYDIASIGQIRCHHAEQPTNVPNLEARRSSLSPASLEYQILVTSGNPVSRLWTRNAPAHLRCAGLVNRGMLRPSTRLLPELETEVSTLQARDSRHPCRLLQKQSHHREAKP